jgi:hypothetical protein
MSNSKVAMLLSETLGQWSADSDRQRMLDRLARERVAAHEAGHAVMARSLTGSQVVVLSAWRDDTTGRYLGNALYSQTCSENAQKYMQQVLIGCGGIVGESILTNRLPPILVVANDLKVIRIAANYLAGHFPAYCDRIMTEHQPKMAVAAQLIPGESPALIGLIDTAMSLTWLMLSFNRTAFDVLRGVLTSLQTLNAGELEKLLRQCPIVNPLEL